MTKHKRHNYENLEIYKRSLANAVKVMELIDNIRPFKLADQISGAAISVPPNIAEGSERTTSKEFRRFLEYSSGSASELATQLTVLKLANRLPGISLDEMIKN